MKLYLNKPSPYARLVMVVAHEKGIAGRLQLEWADPWKNPRELCAVNPFSREPAAFQTESPDLGDLALAVGLGYIDFRLKEMAWRQNRPKLSDWFKAIGTRRSMQVTPHE